MSAPDGQTVILVPYRAPAGSWREEIFQRAVQPYLGLLAERLGAEVILADSGHEPFSVGNSFNRAAEAGRWDVALLHEADFMVDIETAAMAVEMARTPGLGMVYAWTRHIRLNRRGTDKMLAGSRRFSPGSDFRLGSPNSPGGPRAVSRLTWNVAGGFHPGFVGWGYEDNHFLFKTEKTVLSRRVVGDLINAWHPRRRDEPNDPYFAAQTANLALWERLREEGTR